MPRKPLLSYLLPHSPLQTTDSPSSPASPLPPSSTDGAQRAPLSTIQNLKSPAFPPLFTATIPQIPYPWIWKCHLCGSVYRLGVTRRCLEDGHLFCSAPSPPPSPVPSHTSLSSLGLALEKHKSQKKKRRRRQKGCRAEFDYSGWEAYNEWRREIRRIKYRCAASLSHPISRGLRDRREERGGREREERDIWGEMREKKDCWRDCDFPSECLNERVREREVRREELLSSFLSPASEESERDDDGDTLMPDSPVLDAETSSLDVQDSDVDFEERQEGCAASGEGDGEVAGEENLGPVGTDSDGLGEEGQEFSAGRRKSLDAGMETPPSSPLKESFGFADVEAGVWGDEVGEQKEGEKMEQFLL